jgi:hypothetical protein
VQGQVRKSGEERGTTLKEALQDTFLTGCCGLGSSRPGGPGESP